MKAKTVCNYGLALAMSVIAITGCGGGGSTATTSASGQSGKLVKGPVVNATIFADNVSGGIRFIQDAGEVATTTNATTGDFTLPSVPGYNYILVSKGGTDKLTGQAAIQMIAPAGSANVTPFTTLVALAGSTANSTALKASLAALLPAGAGYDSDISVAATTSTAALLVAKSVESLVQIMTNAVISDAGAGNVSATQLAAIQAQTMQAMASQFVAGGAIPTTTAALATSLGTAATAVANTLTTAPGSNINIPAGTATTIATNAVNATNTALGNPGTFTATTLAGGEASLAGLATIGSAVTTAVTTAALTVVATPTPLAYTPPTITVVTPITVVGVTGTTGGSSVGTGTSF